MECRAYHACQPNNGWARHPAPRYHPQKKAIIASARDRWARVRFAIEQQDVDVDPADVVILDEFGSNLNLTRRYARATRGERAVGTVPRNTPPNTTNISSFTLEGIGPSLMIAGSLATVIFETYVEQVLLPSLRAGKIIVLDNLSAHKSPRLHALLAARGCHLWYLPSYSPDFSPIELAFAKVNAELRRQAARTRAALEDAIAAALNQISSAEARSFFVHCGFRPRPDLAQGFCV